MDCIASTPLGLGKGGMAARLKTPFPREPPLAFLCVACCLDKEEFVRITSHQTLLSGSLGFESWGFFFCPLNEWLVGYVVDTVQLLTSL